MMEMEIGTGCLAPRVEVGGLGEVGNEHFQSALLNWQGRGITIKQMTCYPEVFLLFTTQIHDDTRVHVKNTEFLLLRRYSTSELEDVDLRKL